MPSCGHDKRVAFSCKRRGFCQSCAARRTRGKSPVAKAMIELNLPDMTCGHCASTVAPTCKLVDSAVKVEVDLNTKLVKISSNEGRQDFAEALE